MQMKVQGYIEEQIDEYVNMEMVYCDVKVVLEEKNRVDCEVIVLFKCQVVEVVCKVKQEEVEV